MQGIVKFCRRFRCLEDYADLHTASTVLRLFLLVLHLILHLNLNRFPLAARNKIRVGYSRTGMTQFYPFDVFKNFKMTIISSTLVFNWCILTCLFVSLTYLNLASGSYTILMSYLSARSSFCSSWRTTFVFISSILWMAIGLSLRHVNAELRFFLTLTIVHAYRTFPESCTLLVRTGGRHIGFFSNTKENGIETV